MRNTYKLVEKHAIGEGEGRGNIFGADRSGKNRMTTKRG
jgi:hypothetical protein